MFSKPIASGVMLTAILMLGGGALLQADSAGDQARTATVTEEPAAEAAPERTATAPGRVVDSAGFPAVPEAASEEPAAPSRPIVTVNGRPLEGGRTGSESTGPAPVVATAPEAEEAPAAQEETVAIAEPPRPIPRPEGLTVPRQQQAIDYEAIAAIAYGEDRVVPETGEFMSPEQRWALAPLPDEEPYAPYDPRREGLVAVVGPDGEPIWIYEEQVRGNATTNSGVTFQTRRVQSNPFGFVYDEYGW